MIELFCENNSVSSQMLALAVNTPLFLSGDSSNCGKVPQTGLILNSEKPFPREPAVGVSFS